jgi:hypothetical protein
MTGSPVQNMVYGLKYAANGENTMSYLTLQGTTHLRGGSSLFLFSRESCQSQLHSLVLRERESSSKSYY